MDLVRLRKKCNSGVKVNIPGATVFDYSGKLITKGSRSKDDNCFMGVKFLSDCYYVAEYIYFYVYGYHFDKREKEGAAKFS